MLLFQPLAEWPDVYPDHRDRQAYYALPDTLTAQLSPEGVPQLVLARFMADNGVVQGGFIQVQARLYRTAEAELLAILPPDSRLSTCVWRTPKLRLSVRGLDTATVLEASRWFDLPDLDRSSLQAYLPLSSTEAVLLRRLLTDAVGDGTASRAPTSVIGLELQAVCTGLRPGLPYEVRFDAPALRQHLCSSLGLDMGSGLRWHGPRDQVVASVLSVADAAWQWTAVATGDGEVPPELLSELRDLAAQAVVQQCFQALPGGDEQAGLTPRPSLGGLLAAAELVPAAGQPSARWALSLVGPWPHRQLQRWFWDLAPTFARWHDDARVFPCVRPMAPLRTVTIQVVQTVPLHPQGVVQLVVTLQHRNRLGVVVETSVNFTAQATSVWRQDVVCPSFGPGLELKSKVVCYVAQPHDFPKVYGADADWLPADDSCVVMVDSARVGLHPITIRVPEALWRYARALRCRVERRSDHGTEAVRALTMAAPESELVWVLGPEDCVAIHELHLQVEALGNTDQDATAAITLLDTVLDQTSWCLDANRLEPEHADVVRARLDATLARELVYAALEVRALDQPEQQASGPMLTLEGEQPRQFSLWRLSRLAPLQYRWRLRWVARAQPAQGAPPHQDTSSVTGTQAMVTSDWQLGDAAEWVISSLPALPVVVTG